MAGTFGSSLPTSEHIVHDGRSERAESCSGRQGEGQGCRRRTKGRLMRSCSSMHSSALHPSPLRPQLVKKVQPTQLTSLDLDAKSLLSRGFPLGAISYLDRYVMHSCMGTHNACLCSLAAWPPHRFAEEQGGSADSAVDDDD